MPFVAVVVCIYCLCKLLCYCAEIDILDDKSLLSLDTYLLHEFYLGVNFSSAKAISMGHELNCMV